MRRTGCRFGDKRQRSAYNVCTVYVHGRVASGKCRAARKAVRGEGLQSWGVGYRSGDKCQWSAYSVCRVYVRGRVAPGKYRAARKAVRGGRSTELGRGL